VLPDDVRNVTTLVLITHFPTKGAAAGTGLLCASKLMGYGNYRPLMTVLQEDFTQAEREDLYGRLWGRVRSLVTSPLNSGLAQEAVRRLSEAVRADPETMENLRNDLKASLKTRNMTLN